MIAGGCSGGDDDQSTRTSAVDVPAYSVIGNVSVSPSSARFTAVDPYANAVSSADGLKPARPFWYSIGDAGVTIVRVDDNVVVHRVAWPTTYDLALPTGGPDFMSATAPAAGWEPVGITVTYPTEEQLASTSETPSTYLIVVMKHSGYEWASQAVPPPGQDPNLRDAIVASVDPTRDSSLLLQLDVTDPSFSPDIFPAGPVWAGALLGHDAGQPAFDPATGNIYIPNMPSTSLPTAPSDLTSFVSVMMPIAVAETMAAEPTSGAPADPPLVMCGPEHPDEGLLAGTPYVWPCMAEGGEGVLLWEFQNLPPWLTPHVDIVTGQLDGILYGTAPADGTWTFQAKVSDLGEEPGAEPPNVSPWTPVTLNVTPTGVAQEAEAEYEVGASGGMGVAGTGSCTPAPTATPGSMVPSWIDVQPVPGGCAVMGTPPVSGEHYEFTLPGFHFLYPFDREPVIFSGNVLGTYGFDPLPAGVGLSGLAWHEIDKIHDASTEADILNGELLGVEPFSGQLYQILLPQGSIEINEGAGAPVTQGEVDEITPIGEPILASLTDARPDIADALTAHPTLKVRFGDLAIEASRDPNVYVTAPELRDPSGVDSTVIAIGGPTGSTIENGAVLKVTGVRGTTEPAELTLVGTTAISVPGVQAYYEGLDSNLAPAIRTQEPGQIDHGVLWVTGPSSGTAAAIDTALGAVSQSFALEGASALGGVSVYFSTRSAYVAAGAMQSVMIAGSSAMTTPRAPTIWTGETMTFTEGAPGSFGMFATGWPVPTLTIEGALPEGLIFVAQSDGSAVVSGTPAAGTSSDYTVTIHASNGVAPEASFTVIITVVGAPGISSANTTTFTEGVAGSFTVTTTGAASLMYVSFAPALPTWLVATEDEANGSVALDGTPPAGSAGTYVFTITASTGVPPDAVQEFTLIVAPGSGGGGAPVITSASTTTFVVGSAGSFTITATGTPAPALSYWGTLPGGVSFTNHGDGTATLAGTPTGAGNFLFTITAANGVVPEATQGFTLVVNGPVGTPSAITSAATATFTVGAAGTFLVTTTGSPMPLLSYWGNLPAGVTFTANLNGTATLAGTPTAAGSYLFTITAANGVVPNATQNFTLVVNAPAGTAPSITSGNATTFTVGAAGSFAVTATGSPTPSLSESGALPSGVTFVDHGDGTATLGGTATSTGTYPITIGAANGLLPDATQSFTLTINPAPGTSPTITQQPANRTVTAGQTASFTAAASGTAPITAQWQVSTNGGSTWTNVASATSTSYTTPATTTSMNGWQFRVVFTNGYGSATSNAATLTVNALTAPLTVVTTTLPSGTVREAYSYQLQAQGGTQPYTWTLAARRSLPNGLNLSSSGLVSGTPRQAGTYTFAVEVRDSGSQVATSGNLTIVIGPRR